MTCVAISSWCMVWVPSCETRLCSNQKWLVTPWCNCCLTCQSKPYCGSQGPQLCKTGDLFSKGTNSKAPRSTIGWCFQESSSLILFRVLWLKDITTSATIQIWGEAKRMARAYSIWWSTGSHWPITANDVVNFWHWDCYLLARGFQWGILLTDKSFYQSYQKSNASRLVLFQGSVFVSETFRP